MNLDVALLYPNMIDASDIRRTEARKTVIPKQGSIFGDFDDIEETAITSAQKEDKYGDLRESEILNVVLKVASQAFDDFDKIESLPVAKYKL